MPMTRYKRILAVLAVLLLTASSLLYTASAADNSSSAEWPMFRHDPSRSGYATSGSEANSAKLLWSFPTSASVWSSPAIADGLVVVGCKDCRIYCINASNGEKVWSFRTGHEVNSSPAISNGFVFVGCYDGWVYCLNISSGLLFWKSEAGGIVQSSPVVADGRVYVGSGLHDLYCYNASNGGVIWTFPTEKRVDSSPAVVDGVVYVASDDFYLFAVNASTGQCIWRQLTFSNIDSPCVSGGYIYIGSYDGRVICLDASSGAVSWQYQTEDTVTSSAAAAYGCVYIGSEDGSVYCFNASTGHKIWQTKTGYWVWSSPAIASGNVYVGSEDYRIICLDAYTGNEKWSYSTGCNVDSSPAIVDDTLYFGSHDYHLYALKLYNSTAETAEIPTALSANTLAFDAIMVTVWATAAFVIIRCLYVNRKNIGQSLHADTNSNTVQAWLSAHVNLVAVLLLLGFSIFYFLSLSAGPLWAADEKTYSQMAYHMVKSGDYLLPWSFGEPAIWAGKPPLLMWLMAFSYQFMGINNFASRVWIPLFAVASLVVMFYLGKRLYNVQVGFLSVLVLGTFTTFYGFATHAMTDGPLLFFMLASIYFLLLSQDKKHSSRYAVLSGVFFGLALMTKQVEALLIPLIMIAYFVISKKSVRALFTRQFGLSWGVAAAVFVPWVLYMYQRFGGGFLDCYFIYSDVARVMSPLEGHNGGYLFYFNYLVTSEPLWTVFLPFAAGLCVYGMVVKRSKADMLVFSWVLVVLAVFTLAQTKLYWYILPAMPAFAIATANLLYETALKIQRVHSRKNVLAL